MENLKKQVEKIKANGGVFTKEDKKRIKKAFSLPIQKERTENDQAIFEAEWNFRFKK
jgi:hypothetical protein